jgi:hypothetical protein
MGVMVTAITDTITEQAAALRKRVTGILLFLDDDWVLTDPAEREGICGIVGLRHKPTGAEVRVCPVRDRGPKVTDGERLEFSVRWPVLEADPASREGPRTITIRDVCGYSGSQKPFSATVAADRPSADIARDLERRVLGPCVEQWCAAASEVERRRTERQGKLATLEHLASVMGEVLSDYERRRGEFYVRRPKAPTVDVRVDGPNHVHIEVSGSKAAAEAVLRTVWKTIERD